MAKPPVVPSWKGVRRSSGCQLISTPGGVVFLWILMLVTPASSYRDDWYSFSSFEDVVEWHKVYEDTCLPRYDLFREPREYSERDNLQAREELLSPVRFRTENTVKSPENLTLHIYNNIPVRKGYSVSYGFQKNKECLHGQDSECIVLTELGRVRAVVVNAERFPGERLGLNHIKENFLIEKPERFVTILNGGSKLERKFYEAVFLGGYDHSGHRQPYRSSHQIDGKKYPLEIYMYFLDETVPSVSLATILVVLVEESDRDNVHVKPIINTIENKLYDAERRFLEDNKAMIRRERLFHHLGGSTSYDVYNKRQRPKGEPVIQETLANTIVYENTFVRHVEPFERMQAVEAELFFLLEDLEQVTQISNQAQLVLDELREWKGNFLWPKNFSEYQALAYMALRGYTQVKSFRNVTYNFNCENDTYNHFYKQRIKNSELFKHNDKFLKYFPKVASHVKPLYIVGSQVCYHFADLFQIPFDRNKNDSVMKHLSVKEKYQHIKDFVRERKERAQLNLILYEHFHGNSTITLKYHNYSQPHTFEVPDYADDEQSKHIVDGFHEYIIRRDKRRNYIRIKKELVSVIDNVVKRLGFRNAESMQDVLRYLKYGSKQNDLQYTRSKIHRDFAQGTLPGQEKKRTLVEFGGMEVSEDDIKAYAELDPIKADVNENFQISWLIPQDGGYYHYAGSSPVPPCFRAQNMIVFKRPITMSKRQIEVLTRIPTSFDRSEDIRFTAPIVGDTNFFVELKGVDTVQTRITEVIVPIYHQPKNHLFLGHDQVHANAVDQWEKLKEAKKRGSGTLVKASQIMVITLAVIITVL